jgi:hypothetical protein
MAKRFIDTNIFRKDFIRGLQAPYKLLWLYIINECDHAGMWDVEIDVAQTRLGLPEITEADALKSFAGKITVVGNKWFIPDFIEFQYGELKEENRAHNSVIQILKKYNLYKNKPLTSPLQGAMDMDKDMDKEKDKDKDKEKPAKIDFSNYPEPYQSGLKQWYDYKKEKGQTYKKKGWDTTVKSILAKYTNPIDFKDAVLFSITNNYSGLFPDTTKTNNSKPTHKLDTMLNFENDPDYQ